MTIGPLAAEAASLDVQPATLPSPNDTTLAAALKYIAHGWTVVPVCRAAPGGGCTAAALDAHKGDHGIGKHPTATWKTRAATTTEEAARWWGRRTPYGPNIALLCGPSRVFALDLDGPAGEATLAAAVEVLGPLPPTLVNTTSRGRHLLFALPPSMTEAERAALVGSGASLRLDGRRFVSVRTGEASTGLDVRGPGGIIIVAPSVHESGARYQWTGGALATLPPAWCEALPRTQRPGPKRAVGGVPGEAEAMARIAAATAPPGPRPQASGDIRARYRGVLNKALPRLCREIVDAPDGAQNNTIFTNAKHAYGLAIGAGVDLESITPELLAACEQGNHPAQASRLTVDMGRTHAERGGAPSLPERELPERDRRTSAAGRRSTDGAAGAEGETAGQGGEAPAPAAEAAQPRLACTDVGNAERLARRHGNDLRWCEAWGSWLVWSGRQWERDDTGETVRRAVDTVRQIGVEAARCDDEGRRKALWHHALKSESARSIGSMVTLARAQSGLAARPDDLDANPWLLNCRNGIVDLRTGELMPHDRDAMCTKLAPVDYDPAARSDAWDAFLRSALDGDTPDGAEVIEYVRRAVGYSLTGDTSEEVLFFVYGPGGSGKSTFLEAVRATLGDYATTARFDMFVKRVGDAPSANPDEARLRGSRFVASIETDEGKRLSEGTIKRLTGGDVISARELYSRAFDFKPAFKLWLAANDAPRVNDQDDALFRRMRRIVFPHGRTGEGTRDKSIKAMLTNASVTGPAILAWAVQGCLAWQRDGLKTPAAVIASTNAYRTENDPLAEFFAARVTFDARATVARKSVRAAYEAWVRDCGSGDPMSPKRFAERLRARLVAEHGAAHKADASVRLGSIVVDGWRGMRLPDPHAAEDTAAPARRHEPDDAPDDAPGGGWVA